MKAREARRGHDGRRLKEQMPLQPDSQQAVRATPLRPVDCPFLAATYLIQTVVEPSYRDPQIAAESGLQLNLDFG